MDGRGLRVAIDVGGTFTDIVILDRGSRLHTYKVLNDPTRLGGQINDCIDDAASRPGSAEPQGVEALMHATTICSNTVLEGVGARTALVCTRGFRDLIEISGARRPASADLSWSPVPPLVPRRLRLEVGERVLASGEVDAGLEESDIAAAIEVIRSQRIEAVAVAFLHAYANPAHERRAGALLRAALPGVAVCLSHEVCGEIGEYPRSSTTVINAYLLKRVADYLDIVEADLSRHGTPLMVMQTNAGMMASSHARKHPVRMLESGPAAGVLAATRIARELQIENAVALDMGGTTAKACLIEHGEAAATRESEVGGGVNAGHGRGVGHKVRIPGFDIVEIGAGGGSIAAADAVGGLNVGPRSAGSRPGPACYGMGGAAATVTDANVVLGYMNPRQIAGGALAIDLPAAREAIKRDLATPLGLSVTEAAYGVHLVANAAMARAIRSVTSERGRDPRLHTLIVSGGAGPTHAASLAEELGIRTVVAPPYPGLFSAMGLQFAVQSYDRSRSVFFTLDDGASGRIRAAAAEITQDLHASIAGLSLGEAARRRAFVDLRQALEVSLPLPDIDDARLSPTLVEQFHAAHEANYGYCRRAEPINVVGVRVVVEGRAAATPRDVLAPHDELPGAATAAYGETREAYFGPQLGLQQARLLGRRDLRGGGVAGPAIIEEYDTTIVVPPRWTASIDRIGSVVLSYTEA